MSGIIAVYGLVVSVLIAGSRKWYSAHHAAYFIPITSLFFDIGT
jgi:hypothetical protein